MPLMEPSSHRVVDIDHPGSVRLSLLSYWRRWLIPLTCCTTSETRCSGLGSSNGTTADELSLYLKLALWEGDGAALRIMS